MKVKRVLALSMALAMVGVWTPAITSDAAELTQATNAASVKYGNLSKNEQALLAGMFDYEYYKATNPDVVAALGDDRAKLFEHFVKCGIFEGRSLNATFNVSAYASAYADVAAAFGDDIIKYYQHYATFGQKENRTITTLAAAAEAGITVHPIDNPEIALTPAVIKVAEAKGITDTKQAIAAVTSSGSSSSNGNSNTAASNNTTDDSNTKKAFAVSQTNIIFAADDTETTKEFRFLNTPSSGANITLVERDPLAPLVNIINVGTGTDTYSTDIIGTIALTGTRPAETKTEVIKFVLINTGEEVSITVTVEGTNQNPEDSEQDEPQTVSVESVSFNEGATKTATVGDSTFTLTPVFTPADATDKTGTWESSNDQVATVANGEVTIVGEGTANITFTTTDGSKVATCALTVNPAQQAPEPDPDSDPEP